MSLSFNPFDLLDENGGDRPRKAPKQAAPKPAVKPVDAPKPQQQAPAQAKAAPGAKNAPAQGGASAAGKKDNDGKPRQDGQRPRGAGNNKEGAAKRSPAQPRPQQQQGAPARGNDGENAERPRERRDRDHRTHDRPDRRGRQFDRRSGTGRPANENKKGGSGKANWGTIEEGQEAEAPKENENAEKEETPAPAEGEAAPAEPPKAPEKELLGLDEYLATKKNKGPISGVEAPKLRTVEKDDEKWADYAPLKKEDDSAPAKKKKDVKKDASPANGNKDDKALADDLLRFVMPPHEGADSRRGRGKPQPFNREGGRGRGQRVGGDRKRQPAETNVKLTDELQFPSLKGSGGAAPPAHAPAAVAPHAAAAASPVVAPTPQSAPAPVKA